jgi:bacteriocin-like protein
MNNKRPTPTQQPSNTFHNIDADELATISGGCACGCAQANGAAGSPAPGAAQGIAPAAAQQRPFGWF